MKAVLSQQNGSGMHSYHNTTGMKKPELKVAEQKAKKQDVLVLQVFKDNGLKDFTPCEVYELLIKQKKITRMVPITSIRRAISNLTAIGKEDLEKLNEKRNGAYGQPNRTWRLNRVKYNVAVQTELFN